MKKGLYPGVFDLLHPGHLFALDWASKHCDHLTVALNIDPTVDNPKEQKPIESDVDRFIRLLSCKFVDSIVYYEGQQELETLYRSGYYDVAFISIEDKTSHTPTHLATPIFVPQLSDHTSAGLREKMAVNGQQSAISDACGSANSLLSETESREPRAESHFLEFHAERQHRIWAHWMEHQFSLCQEQADGSLVIPAEKVVRWKRQLATPYDALSESERESDREVVREHLSEILS